MIAVRCFSLAVVEDEFQLNQLNPSRWHETVPDLTHIAIADELRLKGLVKHLPDISRSWLARRRRDAETYEELVMDHRAAMDDAAMAVNLRRPRTMLILNYDRADVLAKRLDWFKEPTLMPGTLWNVEPRRKADVNMMTHGGRTVPFMGATYQFMWTDVKPVLAAYSTREEIAERQRAAAAAAAAKPKHPWALD